MPAISPVTAFIRSLPGDYYSLAEAARALGRKQSTLRGWLDRDPKRYGPSFSKHFGQSLVYLYSKADIERIRVDLQAAMQNQPKHWHGGRGRPVLWSTDESAERQRRFVRVGYWRKRSAALQAEGRYPEARLAQEKSEQIRDELRAEAVHRRTELQPRMG